jgi:uncharacterized RDD family membrane protein YckC
MVTPGQPRFVTGEAVRLDIEPARVGSRGLARLIDIAVAVLFLALAAAVTSDLWRDDEAARAVLLGTLVVVTFVGYPVLAETWSRGRTLGKLIVGLRVVRDDGGPVTYRHSLVRALVGLAIEVPGVLGPPLTWAAALTVMVINPQGRRLGDLVAGTLVIHDRPPAQWGWQPAIPAQLRPWAATLDLTGLDDDLAVAVRHFLARNRQIREPTRTQLGQRLAREVSAVINPPPPPGTPGWAYLAAVHYERHERARRQLVAIRAHTARLWPHRDQLNSARPQ